MAQKNHKRQEQQDRLAKIESNKKQALKTAAEAAKEKDKAAVARQEKIE